MTLISAIGECCHRSARGSPCPAVAGYTLIELMVVLAIMVLLVAALPIAFDRMLPSRQVLLAADRLVLDLRRAELLAMRNARPVAVALSERGYSIDHRGDDAVPGVELASNQTLSAVSLPDRQRIDRLMLFPDGSATGVELTLEGRNKRSVIAIDALSGHVRRR